jgi:putative ABC transport system ATP-binding protein
MDEPLLELRDLSKEYSDAGAVRQVLCGVNAHVAAGEAVAVRGPSGSGKTTLLNLIAGIDEPSSGEVLLEGRPLSALPPAQRTRLRRERMGFVFQFFNLIPTLSVLENVLLPAELAGMPASQARRRALHLLQSVGLDGRAGAFPDVLSGGEQQRVALARALVTRPSLILADEPTGNLDAANGEMVMNLLLDLVRRHGSSLVLVTHSRRVAARLDRVLRIENGRLVREDPSSAAAAPRRGDLGVSRAAPDAD